MAQILPGLQDCVCGTSYLDSQATIAAIALQKSCDADFLPEYCTAGPYDLTVDLWQSIQAGQCTCVNYTTDPRTLQLYWNDHPIAVQWDLPAMPSTTLVHSSLLLSIASMTSVAMAAFIFTVIWWRGKRNRRPRRARQEVISMEMVQPPSGTRRPAPVPAVAGVTIDFADTDFELVAQSHDDCSDADDECNDAAQDGQL